MTVKDRKWKEIEGIGKQMKGNERKTEGKCKEHKRKRKKTEEKRQEMGGNWMEITGKKGNERKIHKMKERKNILKGKWKKMIQQCHVTLFFTVSCIRPLRPGAPGARMISFQEEMHDRKWKEMTRKKIGNERTWKENETQWNENKRKWQEVMGSDKEMEEKWKELENKWKEMQ